MTNPNTEPGLGVPSPATSGTDTVRDASPGAPAAASFDDAMREAELRVAEARNNEIVDREAERRRVHQETSARLREVEKGTEAHFALLSLRQEWTLPLDDDDYVLWMQRHLLEQHGKAMADEVSQKRRAKAKEMARGPAIGIAIAAGLATVAGIGWWLRGSTERTQSAVTSSPEATTQDATPAVETARRAAKAEPAAEPTTAPAATAPEATESAAPTAAAAAPPSAAGAPGPTAPGTPGASSPSKGGAMPKPGAPKKDMWEREF